MLGDVGNDMQKRKPKSALKFTLRSLFLLCLISGLLLQFWVLPALRQKRIVQWVVMQQGNVAYQEELVAVEKYSEAQYGVVGEMLGIDFVDRVASVSLRRLDDMRVLNGLPYLRHLSVSQYAGPDLSGLVGMLQLESLTISGSAKVDLVALQRLPSLSFLAFTNSETDDFSSLRNLNELTYLDLYGTCLTDFEDLGHLTQLEYLFLPSSDWQGANILPLKNLVNLKNICVGKTSFSEEQYQELHLALPDCHIEFYPSDD